MFEWLFHAHALALSSIIKLLFSIERFNVSSELCHIRSFWSDLDQIVPTFRSLRFTMTKDERVREITRFPLNSRNIYTCMEIFAHNISLPSLRHPFLQYLTPQIFEQWLGTRLLTHDEPFPEHLSLWYITSAGCLDEWHNFFFTFRSNKCNVHRRWYILFE